MDNYFIIEVIKERSIFRLIKRFSHDIMLLKLNYLINKFFNSSFGVPNIFILTTTTSKIFKVKRTLKMREEQV